MSRTESAVCSICQLFLPEQEGSVSGKFRRGLSTENSSPVVHGSKPSRGLENIWHPADRSWVLWPWVLVSGAKRRSWFGQNQVC